MKKLLTSIAAITFVTVAQNTYCQELKSNNNRILVISGGGSKGAWGAALTQNLSTHYGGLYPLIVGTSTGALIAPFASIGKFDQLNYLYKNLTPEQIFVRSPIKPLRKNFSFFKMPTVGIIPKYKEGDLRFGRVITALFKKYNYLGDATPFRNFLTKNYNIEDFKQCKSLNHEIVVSITNFNKGIVEYKSSKNVGGVDSMINWIYASSSEPMFMAPYKDEKNDISYYDGGVIDNIPIEYAIRQINENKDYQNIQDIDVIIHNPGARLLDSVWNEDTKVVYNPIRHSTIRAPRSAHTKLLAALLRYTEIARNTVRMDDIEKVRELRVIPEPTSNFENYIKINIYYMPDELIIPLNGNDLKFDKDILAMQSASGSKHSTIPDDQFYIRRYNENINNRIDSSTYNKGMNLGDFSKAELEQMGFDALLDKNSTLAQKYLDFVYQQVPTYHNVYEILKLIKKQSQDGIMNWLKIYHDIAYFYTWKMNSNYIEKFQDKYIAELKKSKLNK